MASEIEEMRALLREIEWKGDPSVDWETGWYGACPLCGGLQPPPDEANLRDRDDAAHYAKTNHATVGHAPDCRLDALLKPR